MAGTIDRTPFDPYINKIVTVVQIDGVVTEEVKFEGISQYAIGCAGISTLRGNVLLFTVRLNDIQDVRETKCDLIKVYSEHYMPMQGKEALDKYMNKKVDVLRRDGTWVRGLILEGYQAMGALWMLLLSLPVGQVAKITEIKSEEEQLLERIVFE